MISNENPQLLAADVASSASVSTFARLGLVMYALLIIYASWYPFSNWHDNGLSPAAFLSAKLPHYWTGFDVVTNIIAYFPLGMLMVFALYPKVRGIAAAVLAFMGGMLFSGAMEAVQTFLPNRVSSNLDLLTNSAGACLGAIAGILFSPACLEQSRLLRLRQQWFFHDAGRGLIVVGLWPLAQIYPQGYLFGHGQLMPILSDWFSNWLAPLADLVAPLVDITALLNYELDLMVQEYWLAETIITACGFAGALLTFSCLLRKHGPKITFILLLIVVVLGTKALASALLFAPHNAFVWLTPGAKGGLLLGALLLAGLAYAPIGAQRRLAIVCLLVSFGVVNAVPANPYFVATLQAWIQGKFLNFNGAAQFLSLMWPLFALWFLLHPMHRVKQK